MLSRLKRLCRRREIMLRPPPGGPMAAITRMSRMCLIICFSRSYIKPYSIICRSSSSGGCDPNVSLDGMFRSSRNVRSCFPPTGTNTPLVRFSTWPSRISCTLLLEVLEDMLMVRKLNPLASSCCITISTTEVLPVPTGPTISVGCLASISVRRRYWYRTVSTVGTWMRWNGVSAAKRHDERSFVSQCAHPPALTSTKYSYTVSQLAQVVVHKLAALLVHTGAQRPHEAEQEPLPNQALKLRVLLEGRGTWLGGDWQPVGRGQERAEQPAQRLHPVQLRGRHELRAVL